MNKEVVYSYIGVESTSKKSEERKANTSSDDMWMSQRTIGKLARIQFSNPIFN